MPIKQMAAIRRKAGMTQAEFAAHVREVHGGLARARPLGVSRYVQNHAFDGAYGSARDPGYLGLFHRDLISELWFADVAAMERTFSDPYSQTTIREDGKNFNDFVSAAVALVSETALDVPHPGEGTCKVFYYLATPPGAAAGTLARAIGDLHAAVVRSQPQLVDAVRECVANLPLPSAGANAAHFGGAGMPSYDAILMLRFADDASARAFRPYQRELENGAAARLDPSRSFFTYARESVIFDVARSRA